VHTLGLALFLEKDDIHFFDEIGYYHAPFMHIPLRKSARATCKRIQPLQSTMEFRNPACLKNWIKNNWIGRKTPLPFMTYLDEKQQQLGRRSMHRNRQQLPRPARPPHTNAQSRPWPTAQPSPAPP
jgi:hypothetical protein